MWNVKVVLLMTVAVSLSGCGGVVSLHPLAMPNDKDVIFEGGLIGAWEEVQADQKGLKTTYTVARSESGYSVDLNTDKVNGRMHLLQAGDLRLLDVHYPNDGPSPPVHVFFRLRLAKDTAWVAEMQSDWLKEQIRTGGRLRHEVLMEDDGRIVLTASPTELRQHLLPYLADPRAFDEETELRRIQ